MGSLVLMRSDPDREWTDVECAALLDIGHDLGRAALNARTFDREHALVAELQALDTYKSQLIATVSHELKSPLTTVAGHLEMLESGTIRIGEQARASLAAIGRASDRMTRVIEDLLLLRKVGDAHKPLRLDPVDLGSLVRDAVASPPWRPRTRDSRSTSSTRGRHVLALGEPEELDKVVHNLVSNAVKYTPAGGWVQITTEHREDRAVLTVPTTPASASPRRTRTSCSRSSSAPPTRRPSSSPAPASGSPSSGGSSSGTSGWIDVESARGVGSTFRVTLPAAVDASQDDRVPA